MAAVSMLLLAVVSMFSVPIAPAHLPAGESDDDVLAPATPGAEALGTPVRVMMTPGAENTGDFITWPPALRKGAP